MTLISLTILAKTSSVIQPKYFVMLPEQKIFDVDAHIKSDSIAYFGYRFRKQINQNKIYFAAIKAEFLERLNSTALRKQIVLSVRRILCFDHELNLLWKNSLVYERGYYGTPGEVVTSILPYGVHESNRGIVAIG